MYHGSPQAVRDSTKNMPMIGAFDFAAAFPSIIHDWMWLVLAHRQLSQSFITLFIAIYRNASAIFSHGSEVHTIIHFLSGVLQGCPASALLFNNSLDPCLAYFARVLEKGRKGIFRACADDLAFALPG